MSVKSLCTQYLNALNEGDIAQVLSLFTVDGTVSSPLYGEKNVAQFYEGLFADTARSDTRLLHVYDSTELQDSVALHFEYKWTLSSGELVTFECVDVFYLSEDKSLFSSLKIIYDTAPLRAEFEQLSKG